MRYTLDDVPLVLRVERVSSTAEESPLLNDNDREHLADLVAPSRREQWATARMILRHELGNEAELRYASSGALVLSKPCKGAHYLSVSHSNEWVAVMLCGKRCGVDVESLGRHFSKVASRYITPEEREQFEEQVGEHFEALVWSAKEALYKYGGKEGLDFLQDMIITDIDTSSQTLGAELYGLPTPRVRYQLLDDHILCYLYE